jgi:hypothetical protein
MTASTASAIAGIMSLAPNTVFPTDADTFELQGLSAMVAMPSNPRLYPLFTAMPTSCIGEALRWLPSSNAARRRVSCTAGAAETARRCEAVEALNWGRSNPELRPGWTIDNAHRVLRSHIFPGTNDAPQGIFPEGDE